MNLRKKKRGFLFLEVVLIGLTIGVIFYGRYQTVQRTEGKKVEQEKETSIERESRQAEQLPEQLPEPADTDFVKITDYIPDIVVDLKYATADNFTGTVIYDFKDAYLRYGTVKKTRSGTGKIQSYGILHKNMGCLSSVCGTGKVVASLSKSTLCCKPSQWYEST